MAIHYHCRHCGTKIGTIQEKLISSESLGFHQLTEQERLDMITYNSDGDIQIASICEDCQEAFARNPDYHQFGFLIQ